MATSLISLNPAGNSDALYTAWGLGIYNALLAVGKTRTADTGQVNWASTQTKYTGTTSQTYSIYDMWDLGGSGGFKIKIEYGMGHYHGTNSPNNFAMRITIGDTTDGAGNFTGNVSSPSYLTPANIAAGTTSYPCYFSGAAGRLSMSLYHTFTANFSAIFSVDHVKDAAGDDASLGVSFYNFNNNGSGATAVAVQQYVPGGASVAFPSTPVRPINCLSNDATDGDVAGLGAGFSPSCPFLGYVGYPDLACIFFTNSGQLGQLGTVVPFTLFGSTHSFVLFGSDSTTTGGASYNLTGNSIRNGVGVRYE